MPIRALEVEHWCISQGGYLRLKNDVSHLLAFLLWLVYCRTGICTDQPSASGGDGIVYSQCVCGGG
jgi:hypothetical protein